MCRGKSAEFLPYDDTNEENEDDDNGGRDHALLIHPECDRQRSNKSIRDVSSFTLGDEGITYRLIIFFRVPEARSMAVSAVCNFTCIT